MSNNSYQPGAIDIEYVIIKSKQTGKQLDIKNLIAEFSLFENIKQPFMSMESLITDALALTTRFPIIGNETVDISFKVPVPGMEDKKIVKKMRLMSIKDLSVDQQQRQAYYILRFYDDEYFQDLTKLVRKSYSGIPVSKMVEDIFKTYLRNLDSSATINDLKISETSGTPTLVVPAMRPSETILKLMCRYGKASNYEAISNFMFYSSIDGFHFKTIEEMLDMSKLDYDPDQYYWTEKQISEKSNDAALASSNKKKPYEWMKVNDFKIVNKLDIEESIKKGMYDNTVYYVNPNTSTYGKKTYEYNFDFDKFKRIYTKSKSGNGYKTILEQSDLANRVGDSKNFMIVTNIGDQNVDLNLEDPRYSYLGLQNASLAMLDNVTLILTVPGDNTRKVGDIIDVKLPEFGATDDVIGAIDEYLSGYYLVTGVRHSYNISGGYNTTMVVVKNCFEKTLETRAATNQQASQ